MPIGTVMLRLVPARGLAPLFGIGTDPSLDKKTPTVWWEKFAVAPWRAAQRLCGSRIGATYVGCRARAYVRRNSSTRPSC